MFAHGSLTTDFTEISAFLMAERAKALSETEWKFRARGYGYGLKRTAFGVEVARLPQNTLLGCLTA